MAERQLGKHSANKSNNLEEIPLNMYNSAPQSAKESPDPTFKENLIEYFSNYCGATSIHGIQYIGERGRFIIEKIVWTVIVIAVWSTCFTLIVQSYYKWQNSPVIVTFATTETPIWAIPFPAITICPEVKFNPELFNFTEVFLHKIGEINGRNLSDLEEEYFESAVLMCDKDISEILELVNKTETVPDSIIANMFLLSVSTYSNNILNNTWQGKDLDDIHESLILTEDGVCKSFNMINIISIFKDPGFYNIIEDYPEVRHWSLEGGYAKEAGNDVFPKRTFVSGLKGGAKFNFYIKDRYLNPICSGGLQGFKVMFHSPSDLPNLDKHIRLPLDSAVQVGIIPNMITVSEQLKNYSPQVRKCYFTDQKFLMYFNNYTQNNCMVECLANYTLDHCKCLPFYLPKSRSIPTCGLEKSICVEESKVNVSISKSKNDSTLDDCDCLPLCGSVDYNVEISQSSWNWRDLLKTLDPNRKIASKLNIDYEKDHMSSISIYFKESQFIQSERNELHGYLTFFSDTGGLLGLFIGFSFTSALEILYFLTLRLGCNIKKYGKRFWSGNPELMMAKENVE